MVGRPLVAERNARLLRWRRARRWVGWGLLILFVASIGVARAVASRPADDWIAFNHRAFVASGIVDGNVLRVDGVGEVALLGVVTPVGAERGAGDAVAYLESHAIGKSMTVLLQTPQTRDSRGRLLAYLFEPDGQPLNVAMVRDGVAYAERRSSCSLSASLVLAETAARKKKVGMWNGMSFDQMPIWRQWWLATLPKRGEE